MIFLHILIIAKSVRKRSRLIKELILCLCEGGEGGQYGRGGMMQCLGEGRGEEGGGALNPLQLRAFNA